MSSFAIESLSRIRLSPVLKGVVTGEPIEAGNLWAHEPVMIQVVRRPGWVLCREDGFELSSRFTSGAYPKVKFVGVIKEVAPVSGAATDKELGVEEFQVKYFNNNPLYLDHDKSFYSFLGNKSLLGQKLNSWNPFKLYSDFQSLNGRVKDKGIDGNLKGEGLLKGGLLIITPEEGVIYRHEEETGFEMPYDEIGKVLHDMVKRRSPSTTTTTATASTETCAPASDQ